MRRTGILSRGGGIVLAATIALGGCGKFEQKNPDALRDARAVSKREKAACASATAYDRLKGLLFDEAVQAHQGDRANLDILADYSVARMEKPVVKAWDPELDITSCKGRFILEIPPGAERGFAGDRHLEADIAYTAQAAADGTGFVYQQKGAEPLVARLAAFNLSSVAYRPPPAIDQQQAGALMTERVMAARAETPSAPQAAPAQRSAPAAAPAPDPRQLPAERKLAAAGPEAVPSARQGTAAAERASARSAPAAERPAPASPTGGAGEAAIRGFYGALGAGDGSAASARIIPEKRSTGAYSPAAMSRFYGRLAEPIRLTGIAPLSGGAYRVHYLYSAGRSRCNGDAIVRLSNRGGRDLIRSIQALNGC